MANIGNAELPLNLIDGLDASVMTTEYQSVAYSSALMPEIETIEISHIAETGQLYPN